MVLPRSGAGSSAHQRRSKRVASRPVVQDSSTDSDSTIQEPPSFSKIEEEAERVAQRFQAKNAALAQKAAAERAMRPPLTNRVSKAKQRQTEERHVKRSASNRVSIARGRKDSTSSSEPMLPSPDGWESVKKMTDQEVRREGRKLFGQPFPEELLHESNPQPLEKEERHRALIPRAQFPPELMRPLLPKKVSAKAQSQNAVTTSTNETLSFASHGSQSSKSQPAQARAASVATPSDDVIQVGVSGNQVEGEERGEVGGNDVEESTEESADVFSKTASGMERHSESETDEIANGGDEVEIVELETGNVESHFSSSTPYPRRSLREQQQDFSDKVEDLSPITARNARGTTQKLSEWTPQKSPPISVPPPSSQPGSSQTEGVPSGSNQRQSVAAQGWTAVKEGVTRVPAISPQASEKRKDVSEIIEPSSVQRKEGSTFNHVPSKEGSLPGEIHPLHNIPSTAPPEPPKSLPSSSSSSANSAKDSTAKKGKGKEKPSKAVSKKRSSTTEVEGTSASLPPKAKKSAVSKKTTSQQHLVPVVVLSPLPSIDKDQPPSAPSSSPVQGPSGSGRPSRKAKKQKEIELPLPPKSRGGGKKNVADKSPSPPPISTTPPIFTPSPPALRASSSKQAMQQKRARTSGRRPSPPSDDSPPPPVPSSSQQHEQQPGNSQRQSTSSQSSQPRLRTKRPSIFQSSRNRSAQAAQNSQTKSVKQMAKKEGSGDNNAKKRYVGNDVFGNYRMLSLETVRTLIREVRPEKQFSNAELEAVTLRINHFLEDVFVSLCESTNQPYGFVTFKQLQELLISQILVVPKEGEPPADAVLMAMKTQFSKADWKRSEGILYPSRHSKTFDTEDYFIRH